MATRSARAKLSRLEFNERNWHLSLQSLVDSLDWANPLGSLVILPAELPSASLNVAVSAGSFRRSNGSLVAYAGTASQAITASSTAYLYLTDSGTLTVAGAWPSKGFYCPLAVVVAGASTISSITDARVPWTVLGGGAMIGTATLVAGIATVTTGAVQSSSIIQISRQTAGGTLGHLAVDTIVDGTSFRITSTSNTETSTIVWEIVG